MTALRVGPGIEMSECADEAEVIAEFIITRLRADTDLSGCSDDEKTRTMIAAGMAFFMVGGFMEVTPESLRQNIDAIGANCAVIIELIKLRMDEKL